MKVRKKEALCFRKKKEGGRKRAFEMKTEDLYHYTQNGGPEKLIHWKMEGTELMSLKVTNDKEFQQSLTLPGLFL